MNLQQLLWHLVLIKISQKKEQLQFTTLVVVHSIFLFFNLQMVYLKFFLQMVIHILVEMTGTVLFQTGSSTNSKKIQELICQKIQWLCSVFVKQLKMQKSVFQIRLQQILIFHSLQLMLQVQNICRNL